MAERSEIFPERLLQSGSARVSSDRSRRNLDEISLVFTLIMVAIWAPQGHVNLFANLAATACVVAIALTGRWGRFAMGLTRPLSGAGYMLLAGAFICGVIALIGL